MNPRMTALVRPHFALAPAFALLGFSLSLPAQEDGRIAPEQPAAEEPLAPALARERALAARVDDDRAAALVRDLVALGPRMGGTESGRLSARFVGARFAGLGLAVRTQLARETWCHAETGWDVRVTIEDEEPFALERAWPLGFSPSSEGEAALSVDGATDGVLLAERWRPKRGEARPAMVLDHGGTTSDGAWPVCRPHPRGRRAETAVFGISRPEGERLAAALRSDKDVRVRWSLEATIEEARPLTVVATLPARAEGALPGHVLVCAHGDSDSGGPGANDNASGVAIVLEIARAWTAALEAGELDAPPIEVRFAIWGKEIHSTRDYLESDFGRDVRAVLNFDQAGFGSTGERIHVEPDDLPANTAYVRTAAAVLTAHAGAPGFPERWATNKSLGGTDSYVFSGAKRFREEGFPSVTMFTSAWGQADAHPRTQGMPGESWTDRDEVAIDYDVHYHSAGDTPENTTDEEPHNMGWCARVGLLTTLRWLDVLDAAAEDADRDQ